MLKCSEYPETRSVESWTHSHPPTHPTLCHALVLLRLLDHLLGLLDAMDVAATVGDTDLAYGSAPASETHHSLRSS